MKDELSDKQFYLTPSHPCSYLDDRSARTLFLDPRETVSQSLYGLLSIAGFRRSGSHLYRPHCEGCQACVPVRVPVEHSRWSRRFRRILAANADLRLAVEKPAFARSSSISTPDTSKAGTGTAACFRRSKINSAPFNSNLGTLREAVDGAALVVALGTCATFGGVPAAHPNPSAATGVGDLMAAGAIPVKPLINLSGCPPVPEVITGTIAYYTPTRPSRPWTT